MTSPMQPKPEATSDRYSDIHTVGSSFGQDLKNEAQVRQLLMGEDNGGAVFARAIRNFTQNVAGFVTELFSPEGASYHVITDAVTEQLGPINNAITASGERHLELAAEVDERISEQDRIIEQSNALLGENVAAIDALERENAGITERVTKAVNDADTAIQRADALNTQVSTAVSKADNALSKADGAVSDLASYKKSVQAELNTLGTKVATNLSKAEQGIKDAKTANDAIKSLNTSLNSKIEEQIKASDYLEGELAKADSSVTAVSDLVRVQNPWKWTADWQVGSSITKTETQMFMPAGSATGNYVNRAFTTNPVRLIAGHTYRIRAQGTGDGRIDLGFYRTNSGKYSSSVWPTGSVKNFTGGFDHYVDWVADYPKEGEDGAQGVIHLHANSDVTVTSVTVQDISDLALVQPQINEGFSMALKAHQTLFEGQQNWNTTQEAINRFNATQWATQAGVDAAQNAAVKANTEAIEASYDAIRAMSRKELGGNLVTYLDLTDAEIKAGKTEPDTPVWAKGLTPVAETHSEFKQSYSTGTDSSTFNISESRWVKHQKRVKYRLSAWFYSEADTTAAVYMVLQGKDAKGQTITNAVVSNSIEHKSPAPTSNMWTSGQLLAFRGIKAGWNKFDYTFDIKEEVEQVRISKVTWNYLRGTYGYNDFKIADLRVVPDIPTQEAVDTAQNDAIRAIGDAQRLQATLDLEKREIDKAQNDALKALGKVDRAGSIVPLCPLTDEDLKAGRFTEHLPVWQYGVRYKRDETQEPNWVGKSHPAGHPLMWSNGTGETITYPPEVWTKVDPETEYRVSFWCRTNKAGSKFAMNIVNQGGYNCVEYHERLKKGENEFYAWTGNSVHPVSPFEVPTVWTEYRYIIKFKAGTERVRISRLLWNYTTPDSGANQWFSSFEIVPNTPSQADIDRQQDELIQQGIKFDEQQKVINRANQLMLWNHQNTLELLDIRAQKTWGWKEFISGEQSATYPESNVTCPYANTTGWRRQSTPYFDYYSKSDVGYLAARGNWTGHATVTINWTNGAVDVWNVEVKGGQRVFKFDGGALHIKKRSTAVEIQIENLNRTAYVSIADGKWVAGSSTDNSLIREVNFGSDSELVLRAPFYAYPPAVIRDSAGNKIEVSIDKPVINVPIRAADQSKTAFVFSEASALELPPFSTSTPASGAPQVTFKPE